MFTANLFRQIKWRNSRPTAKIKEFLSNKSFLISAVFRSFVIISCQLVNTTSKLVKMSAPETLKLIHFQTFHFYQSLSANRLHKSISLILLFLKTVSYGYVWFNISNHSSFWTFCVANNCVFWISNRTFPFSKSASKVYSLEINQPLWTHASSESAKVWRAGLELHRTPLSELVIVCEVQIYICNSGCLRHPKVYQVYRDDRGLHFPS